MVGITPIFVIAGFIEGYLTRYTETPDGIRLLFILSCLAFILGYFVVYPVYKARKGFRKLNKGMSLPPNRERFIQTGGIKNISGLFSDLFVLYRKNFQKIAFVAALAAFLFCLAVFPFVSVGTEEPFVFNNLLEFLFSFQVISQLFNTDYLPQLFGINVLIYTLISYVTLLLAFQDISKSPPVSPKKNASVIRLLNVGLISSLVVLLFTYTHHLAPYLFLFLSPVFLLWLYLVFVENKGFFSALARTITLLSGQYGRALGLSFLLGALSFVLFALLSSSLLWLYFDVITWNVVLEENVMIRVQTILATFTSVFLVGLISAMFLQGMAVLYYTLLEIHEAPGLLAKVSQIGEGKRIQGMAKESVG